MATLEQKFSSTTPGGNFFSSQLSSANQLTSVNQLQTRNELAQGSHDETIPLRPIMGPFNNQGINTSIHKTGSTGSKQEQRASFIPRHGTDFVSSAQAIMDPNQAGAVPHPHNKVSDDPLFPTMSRLSAKQRQNSSH